MPMWANMKARFTIDGSHLRMDRIDLDTDGAKSEAAGEIDLARLAGADLRREVAGPLSAHARDLLSRNEPWQLRAMAISTGTFHLFKGGHDLAGTLHESAGRASTTIASRRCTGRCTGRGSGFEVTNAGAESVGGDARFGFSIEPLGIAETADRPIRRHL